MPPDKIVKGKDFDIKDQTRLVVDSDKHLNSDMDCCGPHACCQAQGHLSRQTSDMTLR